VCGSNRLSCSSHSSYQVGKLIASETTGVFENTPKVFEGGGLCLIKFWTEKRGIAEIVGAILLILFLAIQIMPAVRNVSINSDELIASVDTIIKKQITAGTNYNVPALLPKYSDFQLIETTASDFNSGTLLGNITAKSDTNNDGYLTLGNYNWTMLNNFTFTRNTVAYQLNGSQVNTNVPRLEIGKSNEAITFEKRTTNYLSYIYSSGSSTMLQFFSPTWSGSSLTIYGEQTSPVSGISVIKHVAKYDDDYIAAKDRNGITWQIASTAKMPVSSGEYVTFSVWAKGQNGGEQIELFIFDYNSSSGSFRVRKQQAFTITNTWKRYSITTQVATDAQYAWCRVDNNLANQTVYWCAPQLEKDEVATSFTTGTRNNETAYITFDSGSYPTQEGTVSLWVKPLYARTVSGRQQFIGIGGTRFVSANEDSKSINIWFDNISNPSQKGILGSVGTGSSSIVVADGSSSLDPNKWYHIVLTWKTNDSVKLYVNGTLAGSTTIGSVVPSSSFVYNKIFIGAHSLGGFNADALIDEVVFASRAWTAAEVKQTYDTLIPPVDNIIGYYSFDSAGIYKNIGMRISPVYDISCVGPAQDSAITWNASVPVGTDLIIQSNLSLDGGNTWLGWKTCQNANMIPDINGELNLSNGMLQIREILMSSSQTYVPTLNDVTIQITTQGSTLGLNHQYAATSQSQIILYDNGLENTSLTGGWWVTTQDSYLGSNRACYKNSNTMYFYGNNPSDGTYLLGSLTTLNKINVSGKKLKIHFTRIKRTSTIWAGKYYTRWVVLLSRTPCPTNILGGTSDGVWMLDGINVEPFKSTATLDLSDYTLTVDVSSVSEPVHINILFAIDFPAGNYMEATVDKVWLE